MAIRSNTFDNATTLEKLWLKDNRISELQNCSFKGANNLTEILLARNKIENIDSGAFQDLHKLKKLDLRENLIKTLRDKLFSSLPEIVNISLSANPIKHVGQEVFPKHAKLNCVDLTNIGCSEDKHEFTYKGDVFVADLISDFIIRKNCSLKIERETETKVWFFERTVVINVSVFVLSSGFILCACLFIGSKILTTKLRNEAVGVGRDESGNGTYAEIGNEVRNRALVPFPLNDGPLYLEMNHVLGNKHKRALRFPETP
jgi:hypothetical protein